MTPRVAVALVILGFAASRAFPQVPADGEFRVNTSTYSDQFRPSIASDASGAFVVVWESLVHDGDGAAVLAQRYDASGAPRGAESQVNTYTTGSQMRPSVASSAMGRFVVVWQSGSGQDGDAGGVFGQRYDASGARSGSEFQINSFTIGDQSSPTVASDPAGNFVVTWTSNGQDGSMGGIFARRFSASGAMLGAEFQVNSYTTNHQEGSAIAVDRSGNFVVAWTSEGQGGGLTNVFARRFDVQGAPLGSEFQVNTPFVWHHRPSIASDAEGRFVIAWARVDYIGGPGQPQRPGRVMAQRFDSSGVPQGPAFQVSPFTIRSSSVFAPAVLCDDLGNFVIAWDGSPYPPGPPGPPLPSPVVGQRYDASGAPRGPVFPVSSSPVDHTSRNVSIGGDGAGNFVVAWQNMQDGSGEGVFGQRFGGLLPSALAVDSVPSAGSDGNRVLEPGESVDARPSWQNRNGATQTFDGSVLSLSGPPASGVSYQLLDGVGAYGTVPNGATAPCSDCYQAAVAFGGTRPSFHWDATLTERLTPDALGQTKPWSIHVGESFVDVPKASPYYRFVETLLHRGVTAGCATGVYCAGSLTTREQMAAFVLLAREGPGYAPLACSPVTMFADVPATSIFCDVIEELARRGVVSGCGGGNYCPSSAVTREQMAIFVLRTLDPTLSPPACTTPLFADVPASNPYCRWIEELARRGVVTGCGSGNYCPVAPVTREQMAVFITGTFGLSLYGP